MGYGESLKGGKSLKPGIFKTGNLQKGESQGGGGGEESLK